jgi:hypothetical protein
MVEKWDEKSYPTFIPWSSSKTLVNTGVFELAVGREVPLFSMHQVISTLTFCSSVQIGLLVATPVFADP